MRDEENLFEGTTTVLSSPSELSELRPHDAALVSPRLRRLFADPPRSLRELASATSFAPLATWLRRMAKVGGCELVIDRPSRWLARRGMAPSVSLRVGAADTKVHLSGPLPRLPKRIPGALREVLGSVGTVTLQYGAAGGLLAPREQRSLVDLYAEIVRNLGEPFQDATGQMRDMLVPGRLLFAYGIFFPEASDFKFEVKHIVFVGREPNEWRFEAPDWWVQQVREIGDFYLKAQWPDGNIDRG